MAQQEADEGALARVADREGDDPHPRAVEAAYEFEELADAILEKDGELPKRRPAAPTGGREPDTRLVTTTGQAHVRLLHTNR